ncbi:MAG: DUF1638 domain-containing protein [Phycisphaerae bacterium]|nr:DUF1638 domain-containing protein [Phycisphaerae bacterium]
MRLKFVVCKVLQREAYLCAARSTNVVDVVLMPQGLHNEPDKLRTTVQEALRQTCDVQGRPYDAILLGYGLCSNGILGLSATIPIVAARGHDCITLLLGSRQAYQAYFDSHRGVYWYSPGWIESQTQPGRERFDRLLAEYRQKYGPDNAEYLMQMEQGWMKEYAWATYVDWGLPGSEEYKQYTRQCAEFLNWKYDEIEGSASLMQRMVDGVWTEEDFLVVKPGEHIAEDLTNPGIIRTEPQ